MNEVDKYDKLFESIKHIGENEVFGNYYNRINSSILKTKQIFTRTGTRIFVCSKTKKNRCRWR